MKRVFLEKYGFLSWFFVLVIALTIFYISSLTFKGIGVPSPMSYIYHFFIFFWLAFFLSIAFTRGRNFNLIIPSIFIALMYALFDEVHQLFVSGRACSFSDFILDSAGILSAVFLYLITVKIRSKSDY